jgi:hypothetical protein
MIVWSEDYGRRPLPLRSGGESFSHSSMSKNPLPGELQIVVADKFKELCGIDAAPRENVMRIG